jgi:hypothetical protein
MGVGTLNEPLNHIEVMETSTRVKNDFMNLMSSLIEFL